MSNKKAPTPSKESSAVNIIIGIIIAALVIVLAATVFLIVKLISDDTSTPAGGKETTAGTTAETTPSKVDMTAVKAEIDALDATDFVESDKTSEYVKISVKDHGDIIVRLREDIAPITVKNFQNLVSKKFYDGLTIHRVSKNFVIQGGDPKGNGTGSPDPIKGEFTSNGFQNDLQHIKGVLSMARRSNSNDSDSCQFFICTADARSSLDGMYAGFGYVVAGLDVVDSISAVEVNDETPVDTITMEKVCFVTKK